MTTFAQPRRLSALLLSVMATGALAACGSSNSPRAKTFTTRSLALGCRATAATDQTITTAKYVYLLHVGHPEQMVMPDEAKARHITTGEMMVGGSMAQMYANTPGATPHHLEVHICNRATGRVVTNAMPAITLAPSSHAAPQNVPVMVMQGITAGVADLHYGNNVPMRSGSTYTVSIRLGSDRAVFHYKVAPGA